MEEYFLSGYCRRLDRSIIVSADVDGKCLKQVDCQYGHCVHEPNCTIAAQIRELTKAE